MTFALAGLSTLCIAAALSARDVNEEALKKLLERYPAADANKDGKLTVEEARAYRAKLTGKSEPAAANQPDDAAQKAARAAKKAKRSAGPEIKPDRADLSYG